MTTRLYFERVAPDSQRLLNLWPLSNINILQKLRTSTIVSWPTVKKESEKRWQLKIWQQNINMVKLPKVSRNMGKGLWPWSGEGFELEVDLFTTKIVYAQY